MPLEGFAESTPDGVVTGWAWNSDAPETPVEVEVVDGGAHYARIVADEYNEALALAGRRGGECRFVASVPSSSSFRVILAGTPHCLAMSPIDGPAPVWNWLDAEGLPYRPAVLVHRLCHDLLGRPATQAQLSRFAAGTDSPHALVGLVRDILDEMTTAGLFTVRDVIRQCYLGVLARPVDPDGLATFSAALLGGMSVSEMIRRLLDSPEFAAHLGRDARPDALSELRQITRTLNAAVTTLTLHALAPPVRGAGPGTDT